MMAALGLFGPFTAFVYIFLGLTQNANAFWDQPPLFCLKYRRIALFSGRIESPKPLPTNEGPYF
ncbi:hypothetical protein P9726_13965, partial [Geobacillus stearothermophilus]|uniref:hypothetical protein n=1 Tax=Geobacillus stearothermophilus TaxID=1422 RepID=UPI002E1C64E3|nr:hypothetical protein [Geobacillus stearothermophilus]